MPRKFASHATDAVIRVQLSMVHALCDQIGLTSDDCRKALNLTEQEWLGWTRFQAGGPLPAEPSLPEMLRRLGKVAFALSMLADGSDPSPDTRLQSPDVLYRSCLAYDRV